MSESDVYRRQILTTKADPLAVRVEVVSSLENHHILRYGFFCFLMSIDTYYRST